VDTLVFLPEVGGTSLHHHNVTSSDENSSWGKKKLKLGQEETQLRYPKKV
jgi:hypothetical protein